MEACNKVLYYIISKNCIPWFFTYIHKWLLLDLMNVGPHELKVAHNPFLPLRQLSVLHTSTRLGFLQKSPQAGSQALIPCLQHHHRLSQLFGYLLPEQLFPGCILIRCELHIEKDRMCLQPIHHILVWHAFCLFALSVWLTAPSMSVSSESTVSCDCWDWVWSLPLEAVSIRFSTSPCWSSLWGACTSTATRTCVSLTVDVPCVVVFRPRPLRLPTV